MERFEASLAILKSLGVEVVDPVKFSEWSLEHSKKDPDEWKFAQRISLARSLSPNFPTTRVCC